MTRYQDLLTELHETHPQPNPNYYKTLTDNAETIILEVALRGQQDVARELGTSQSKLSNLIPLFKEFANGKRNAGA